MMDIGRLEFVQQGNDHRAVGDDGEETDAPVGLVARTNGYLVPRDDAALSKKGMKPSNSFGQVLVIERHTLVIGQGGKFPVGLETIGIYLVKTFHTSLKTYITGSGVHRKGF